jgi:hypothetical protein
MAFRATQPRADASLSGPRRSWLRLKGPLPRPTARRSRSRQLTTRARLSEAVRSSCSNDPFGFGGSYALSQVTEPPPSGPPREGSLRAPLSDGHSGRNVAVDVHEVDGGELLAHHVLSRPNRRRSSARRRRKSSPRAS